MAASPRLHPGFTARTGKRAGLSPVMAAYERAERDGVLSLDDGEVVWHWPTGNEVSGR